MSVLSDTQELAAKAVNVLLTKIPDKGAAFGVTSNGTALWFAETSNQLAAIRL